MRALLRRPKAWIILLTLAILSLLLYLPIKNVLDVAAVQNAVDRDWEISFIDASRLPSGMPAMLPASLDDKADDVLEYFYGDTDGYSGRESAKTRNRTIVYRDRFRAFFQGSIEEINVYYFQKFHGDLGAAFARFSHLRRVAVEENEQNLPTVAEWTHLCTRLRELPNLESIEIGGAWITDAALAPLAGHPHLRSLTITHGRLTEACTETFATIPNLATLHIEDQIYEGEAWLPFEKRAAIIVALPGVTVELP